MRTLGIAVALTSLALAVGTSSAEPGVAGHTRVRLLDPAPLALKGVGFAPREWVRLTVSLGETTVVRRLRADGAGVFTTLFRTIRYDRCSGPLSVKAVGSRGSRTSWELVPLECPNDDRNS